VVLKATIKDPKSQGDAKSESLEDEIALLAIGLHKMLMKKNFNFINSRDDHP